jgi:FkbM family methyltransferase
MPYDQFERDAGALISSGFAPKRMSLPVRLARRVLWPLIRPFHFFTLRSVADLEGSMNAHRNEVSIEAGCLRDEVGSLRDEAGGLRDEVAQIQRMYAHLALQLKEEEERRARTDADTAGAIHGLQRACDRTTDEIRLIRGDLLTAVSDRIDHVQRLYAHLADEMPKFVQPLVDFRSESAAILNRFRVYSSDLDALKARQADLERGAAETVDALRRDLDERSNALGDGLARASDDMRALVDDLRSELARLAALEDHLEQSTRSVEAAVGEVRAGGDQRDAELGDRISAVDVKVELASAKQDHEIRPKIEQIGHAVSTVQEALTGANSLTAELRSLKARIDAPHIVMETIEDGVALLNSRDLITKILHETGKWDPHVVEVMRQVARDRPGVAVDVGAHCGLHTIAMSRVFNKVLSFEPNDVSYRLLQANVALNRLDNVTLYNRPLFSREASLALGRPELQENPVPRDSHNGFDLAAAPNPGSFFFLPVEEGHGMPFEHVSLTLDSLGLTGLDFLKIDVQGADGEVMLGGRSTIERFKPVIVFEWEDRLSENFLVSLSDVKDLLGPMGYTLSVLKAHNEKQCDYIAMPIGV